MGVEAGEIIRGIPAKLNTQAYPVGKGAGRHSEKHMLRNAASEQTWMTQQSVSVPRSHAQPSPCASGWAPGL